jgi:hypothetical protein
MRIGTVTQFGNGVGRIEDLDDNLALVTFHVGDLSPRDWKPKPGDRVGYEIATAIGLRVSCSKVWPL